MRGIASKLPDDTLAAALAPISDRCEQLDWAVDLQSGPLRFPYYDEDEPGNLLAYHHLEEGVGLPTHSMHWFERGFLPRHADCLILDEWSYYLAFDSRTVSPAELAALVAADMSPGPRLFDAVARANLLYLLRVDTGWWEAYTPDTELLNRLARGWAGVNATSDRWQDGRPAQYPLGDAAAT
jgi:hypothetical protein